MLKLVTLSSRQTFDVGKHLGKLLCPGDILCLFGELGAGKTKFAQGVAAGLGVCKPVTSPTFILIREYAGRLPFYHMDAYRLSSSEEMEDLGYEEYFFGRGVTLLEWADRVKDILPGERLDIEINRCFNDSEPNDDESNDNESNDSESNDSESVEDNRRIFIFRPHGERYRRLVEELSKLVLLGKRS